MAFTADRLLALAIALGYLIAAAILPHPGIGSLVMLAVVLAVPLVLIWYPEIGTSWPRKKTVIGTYADRGRVTRDSPPWLVYLLGWFFLVGLPVVVYLTSRP
jgi:hypothetical protein